MTCNNVHFNAELSHLIDGTWFYGCQLTSEPTAYAFMDCVAMDGSNCGSYGMCTSYQDGLELGSHNVDNLVASLESGEKDLSAAQSRIRWLEDDTFHAHELKTKLAEANTNFQAKLSRVKTILKLEKKIKLKN